MRKVWKEITGGREWIVDADLKDFFGSVEHEKLLTLVAQKVADGRVLRLIEAMLKAGSYGKGRLFPSERGTLQGGVVSPLLANVYLHYVLDQWTDQWRQNRPGEVTIVRYADDAIIGFQNENEARQYLKDLQERLGDFGLELNQDKTRLIRFGRFARLNREERGEGKPESFTFLGFQHICAKNSLGRFEVRRITDGNRRRKKLQEIKQELRRKMHEPIAKTGEWLRSVLNGYYPYHAIPGNTAVLKGFRTQVARRWFRALAQRSQRRPTWEKLGKVLEHWLPIPQVAHEFPDVRFDASRLGHIQGKNRVR